MRSTLLSFCFVVALVLKKSETAPHTTVSDVDGYLTCRLPITETEIKKEDPSHDHCCCQDNGTCKSYRKSSHFCKSGDIKPLGNISVKKENTVQEENRFRDCRSGTFLRNYMSCNSSTGEVILFSDASFRSQKLCKNQLPRGPDTGPAIRLYNKEVHIQGLVYKIRVDMSATFLFIDLLPFNITSLMGVVPPRCQVKGQTALQVKIELPAAGECTTLNEVQNYMQDKTLDIWVSLRYLRCYQAKNHLILSIPEESTHHWMMISQRPFQ